MGRITKVAMFAMLAISLDISPAIVLSAASQTITITIRETIANQGTISVLVKKYAVPAGLKEDIQEVLRVTKSKGKKGKKYLKMTRTDRKKLLFDSIIGLFKVFIYKVDGDQACFLSTLGSSDRN